MRVGVKVHEDMNCRSMCVYLGAGSRLLCYATWLSLSLISQGTFLLLLQLSLLYSPAATERLLALTAWQFIHRFRSVFSPAYLIRSGLWSIDLLLLLLLYIEYVVTKLDI